MPEVLRLSDSKHEDDKIGQLETAPELSSAGRPRSVSGGWLVPLILRRPPRAQEIAIVGEGGASFPRDPAQECRSMIAPRSVVRDHG
jgi:hypothetical protein